MDYNKDYANKYLEYKLKYLNLKKVMIGGNKKYDLYLFKADWCGHCQQFKNNWEILKSDQELSKKINFITLDSEKNASSIKEWNVSGYPTIIFKKDNNAVEYNGERNVNSIKKFINENI